MFVIIVCIIKARGKYKKKKLSNLEFELHAINVKCDNFKKIMRHIKFNKHFWFSRFFFSCKIIELFEIHVFLRSLRSNQLKMCNFFAYNFSHQIESYLNLLPMTIKRIQFCTFGGHICYVVCIIKRKQMVSIHSNIIYIVERFIFV